MPAWMRHSADFPEFWEIGPEDTVVDIGCGHEGGACVAAGRLGAEVIALDIAPELVRQLEAVMRGVPARSFRAIVSDCNPIPLPDATADLVICTEVLEHVDAPDRIIAELARIGKPGARYILSVPDEASEALMRLAVHPTYFDRPGHLRIFSAADFDRLIRSAGLEIERRARQPHNFYWAFHCLLRATIDPNGLAPGTIPMEFPAIDDWNRVWHALEGSSKSEAVIEALDRLVPRSQAVIARRPGGTPRVRSPRTNIDRIEPVSSPDLRFDQEAALPVSGPIARLSGRVKQAIKQGALRIGRLELRWNVSRRPRSAA